MVAGPLACLTPPRMPSAALVRGWRRGAPDLHLHRPSWGRTTEKSAADGRVGEETHAPAATKGRPGRTERTAAQASQRVRSSEGAIPRSACGVRGVGVRGVGVLGKSMSLSSMVWRRSEGELGVTGPAAMCSQGQIADVASHSLCCQRNTQKYANTFKYSYRLSLTKVWM
jgi:hypothetical protein